MVMDREGRSVGAGDVVEIVAQGPPHPRAVVEQVVRGRVAVKTDTRMGFKVTTYAGQDVAVLRGNEA